MVGISLVQVMSSPWACMRHLGWFDMHRRGYSFVLSLESRSSWLSPFSIHAGTGGRSGSSGKCCSRAEEEYSRRPVGVVRGLALGSLQKGLRPAGSSFTVGSQGITKYFFFLSSSQEMSWSTPEASKESFCFSSWVLPWVYCSLSPSFSAMKVTISKLQRDSPTGSMQWSSR